jgi:hypothetical protein
MNGTVPNVCLKYDKDERIYNLDYEALEKVIGEMGLSFLAYNLRRAITLVGVDKLIEAAREGTTRGISLLFAIITPRKPELSEIKGFC